MIKSIDCRFSLKTINIRFSFFFSFYVEQIIRKERVLIRKST